MAYKRTGRPPGRPKTKEYKTVLARIPAELAELVEQYAAERQQSVSTLIREGLEYRIGDGDPRGIGVYLVQPTGISEKVYSSNTETVLGAQGGEALQEVRALLVQQGEQIQALTQALERQRVPVSDGMYSSNTENAPSVLPDSVAPRVKSDKATVIARLQQMHGTGLDSTQIAMVLQAEGVPTLSGKGEWHAGTVRKLFGAMKV